MSEITEKQYSIDTSKVLTVLKSCKNNAHLKGALTMYERWYDKYKKFASKFQVLSFFSANGEMIGIINTKLEHYNEETKD